jgi:hypothetical protein
MKMDLDKKIDEAIKRLLGSASKLQVRSYTREHYPGEHEFVAVAWLGGREACHDFAWLKRQSPDPFFYLQYSDDPVQFFATIDEMVKHIHWLTQRALEEEAADAEAEHAAAARYAEVKAKLAAAQQRKDSTT